MFVFFDKHRRIVRMVILTWRPGQQDGEEDEAAPPEEDEVAPPEEDDEDSE